MGAAALIGTSSLLNQNQPTEPSAAALMAVAIGVLFGSLWIILRSVIGLLRSDSLTGWVLWRQGMLGAITVGVLLYLQGIRSLSISEASLIILAAVLFELFFRSDKIDARRVQS